VHVPLVHAGLCAYGLLTIFSANVFVVWANSEFSASEYTARTEQYDFNNRLEVRNAQGNLEVPPLHAPVARSRLLRGSLLSVGRAFPSGMVAVVQARRTISRLRPLSYRGADVFLVAFSLISKASYENVSKKLSWHVACRGGSIQLWPSVGIPDFHRYPPVASLVALKSIVLLNHLLMAPGRLGSGPAFLMHRWPLCLLRCTLCSGFRNSSTTAPQVPIVLVGTKLG